VPDQLEEWHIYQAVVGAWPLSPSELKGFSERLQQYVVKAAREAKSHTSWLDPDGAHERALQGFVRALLSSRNRRWRSDLEDLLRRIALPAAVNALAQTVLKITAPGIPDLYQGSELWFQALVDPDNRRPVDFEHRAVTLAGLEEATPEALVKGWGDGAIKLDVTRRALRFRRDHRELFDEGIYLPLEIRGRRRAHVVAFARRRGDEWSITVVPRHVARLTRPGGPAVGDTWTGTTVGLPKRAPETYVDVLTDRSVRATDGSLRVREVFTTLPIAVLREG
jgi:(1->4)-alpha-D-glucan 1-alpha-D-glucosylmutase